jgi:hypothetical protein
VNADMGIRLGQIAPRRQSSMRDYTTTRVKRRSVVSRCLTALLLVLAVAACGEPPVSSEKTAAPLSIRDMLIDCAGAIAAEGNVDPLVEPSTGTREENAL